MKKSFIFFQVIALCGLAILSCSRRPLVDQVPENAVEAEKPHWVQSKPASSIYFYGIGVAQKQTGNTDHLENAKKNALNDLASEIKVNVSSNSILYTLERDYKFQSEFIETIRTTTDQDLEGFEMADSWESNEQYWVFYRLNRADYYARKEAEKQAVLKNAADFYQRGLEAWNNQQVTSAFDLQIRALGVMKPYWAESNEYKFGGQEVLLDNAILQQLQDMSNRISLQAQPNRITLNLDNSFEQVCAIIAQDASNAQRLSAVPVNYRFRSSSGLERGTRNTDNKGEVAVSISDPDLMQTYNELQVTVDIEKMFDPRALDRETRQIVRGLSSPELTVPIELIRPVFHLESTEQNLHYREKLSVLRDHLSSEIIKRGLPVSQDKGKAQIMVRVEGKTRDGGQSNGFAIAYLDMSIKFTNPAGTKVFYETSFNDLKGVSGTTERAGLRAFDKGQEIMDRSFMEKVLKAII